MRARVPWSPAGDAAHGLVRLGAAALVVLMVGTAGGCATARESVTPGQRVVVERAEEIVDGRTVRRGTGVVGELVRQVGDTVWVRARPTEEPRSFVLVGRSWIAPRAPSAVAESWLPGDSVLSRPSGAGSARRWSVLELRGDTLVLAGPARDGPPAGPDLRRQVRRVRPGAHLALGGAAIGGALLLRAHQNSNVDSELGGGDFGAAFLYLALLSLGAGQLIDAVQPDVGWDRIPAELVPTVRTAADAPALELGWRLRIEARGR